MILKNRGPYGLFFFMAMSLVIHAALLKWPVTVPQKDPEPILLLLKGRASEDIHRTTAADPAAPNSPSGTRKKQAGHRKKTAEKSAWPEQKRAAKLSEEKIRAKKVGHTLKRAEKAAATGRRPSRIRNKQPEREQVPARETALLQTAGLKHDQGAGLIAGPKAASHGLKKSGRPGSERDQKGISSYFSRIRQIIEGHRYYPRQARRMGRQGEVVVAFRVEADGTISSITLKRPCRHKELNRAALKTVALASPLPAPDKGLEPPLDLEILISFQLAQ